MPSIPVSDLCLLTYLLLPSGTLNAWCPPADEAMTLPPFYRPHASCEFHSFSSVQFSRSVVSDSLQPHGLQHARPHCPIANSSSLLKLMSIESVMPSNLSSFIMPSSVVPVTSCPQSFPASGSFPTSLLFTIRWPEYWSFSFSISASNEYSGLN